MAITRIRGGQIQDRTIDGLKITQGVLLNEHLASNAAIAETKLDINWASRYQSALTTKKVVDFVQINKVNASSVAELDLSAGASPTIVNTNAIATSAGTEEGILVDGDKNRAVLRKSGLGDPILDAKGQEVYGRVVFVLGDAGAATPIPNKFVLKFFVFDATLATPAEVAFTMPTATDIDFQYAQRFNLATVSELFAANEKFVDGAADATAHLNIMQLAKDLYGATYTLDRDGNANLVKSLATQISDEVTRAQGAETTLQTNIDNEKTRATNAENAIKTDLAAVTVGKGASLVGIEDAGLLITATTVEGALAEIFNNVNTEVTNRTNADNLIKTDLAATTTGKGASLVGVEVGKGLTGTTVEAVLENINGRVGTLETNGGAEVTATHTRDIATANGYYPIAAFASLEARLIDIETIADVQFKLNQNALTELESAGVQSGLVVGAQATPDMTVAVSAGVVYTAEGKRFAVVAGNKTIAAADTTNPRIDVVYVDAAGAVQVAQGVAAASPAVPSLPANAVQLAEVTVAAAATTITNTVIADKKVAVATGTEVQVARGTRPSLDSRLSVAINANGTLKEGTKIHVHKKNISTIATNTSIVNMPVNETFVTDGTLDVYVNGILQANGTNFTEVTDVNGKGTGINFGSDTLLVGDVVVIKYINYNAQ